MTRWKAAGSHLALSILVIGGIALTAFLLWYPYGIYSVSGLDRIILIMLGIDLTAGPLLTLIVFRAGKPSLKFDLSVIALAQIAFLAYGLHTLWGGRPVFLVGTPEVFTVVFANEISPEDLALASKPEWRQLSWTGPVLVGARMPDDADERAAVIDDFMSGGAGVERSPKHYRDFAMVAPEILANARPPTETGQGSGDAGNRVIPIVSRRGEGEMLINGTSALPLSVIR